MGYGLIERSLGRADGEGAASVKTGPVEEVHELVETPSFRAHEVFRRDPHVFEGDLTGVGAPDGELAVELVRLIAGPVCLHDDRAQPVCFFGFFGSVTQSTTRNSPTVAIGDEHLVPRDHVLVSVLDRPWW